MATATGMTRQDLIVAQFLQRTAREAERLADTIDCARKGEVLIAAQLDGILSKAGFTFRLMTGRRWNEVAEMDLHAEEPAAWTQEPLASRGVMLSTKDVA